MIPQSRYLRQLQQHLGRHVEDDSLVQLLSDLGYDYHLLPGRTRRHKLQHFLNQCAGAGHLNALINLLYHQYPAIGWNEFLPGVPDQLHKESSSTNRNGLPAAHLAELKGWLLSMNLTTSAPGSQEREIARREILGSWPYLGKADKRELLLFLAEMDLLAGDQPPVNLKGVDLSSLDLSWLKLSHCNLSQADLSQSDLSLASLGMATLSGANLRGAALRAYLVDADLVGADLRECAASGAQLTGAKLTGANLRLADLRGADLRDADLTGADLTLANLEDADLTGAQLRWTIFNHTNLAGIQPTSILQGRS